jgi:hypothetical protein
VAACGYEITAITTGRVPTITMLCGRHRLLAPAVLTVLAIHLYRTPRMRPDRDCVLCPESF